MKFPPMYIFRFPPLMLSLGLGLIVGKTNKIISCKSDFHVITFIKCKCFISIPNLRCANKHTITFKSNMTFLKPFIFISF